MRGRVGAVELSSHLDHRIEVNVSAPYRIRLVPQTMRIFEPSVRRDVLRVTTVLAVLVASPPTPIASDSVNRLASAATDPDFGPNVTIFDPTTPAATIQATLDAVFKAQESSEFGDARFALMFKPGTYDVDAKVGFYTQISGLGLSPDDVVIRGGVRADARWRKGNATLNFWRIAENMSVNPSGGFDRWAVSQAAPMRRMHIRGDLVLDDGGWSSGGFLADSRIDGRVRSGSQQQWFTRSSELGGWTGANWNMVFVGTRNAPQQSFPDPPYTTLASAPVIREKPFLYVDARGEWKVFVPAFRSNASGTTWSTSHAAGVSHPISDFVIVKPGSPGSPSSSAAAMNDALARHKHLIITPGIYHLDAPLRVTRANTIVLGLGLATLVADNGTSAIIVDDVDGVIVAGLLIEAGATNSPVLIQVGPPGGGSSANHSSNPTLLSDVFVRVGGAGVGKATQSLRINSNDVIGDHLWLWRADHGTGVGWTSNTAANGLVVNGNDVVMYGLFVEHYQQYQVRWNGNGGRTYFFQNEMPYDVPYQSEWQSGATNGFAAYQVAASVTSHEAWGLGSYCFFNRNPSVVADHAFEAPVAPNVRFHDMVIVSLGGGKGSILHVINDVGPAATAGGTVQKLVGGSHRGEEAALKVEVVAIRDMLGARHSDRTLVVDTLFAQPGQAPPAMTLVRRPAARHRALVDSIDRPRMTTGRDTLYVRASAPRFDESAATISVTVSGRQQGEGRRGNFYETVRFALRRDGTRWVVVQREQLGIS